MTDLRKAAEMALEAMKISAPVFSPHIFTRAFKALEAALAQSEQNCAECGVKASDGYALYCVACAEKFTQPEQEPVAWMYVNEDGECEQIEYGKPFDDPYVTPLYAHPPKREWEFLDDDEVIALANKEGWNIQVENLPANLLRVRVGALGRAIQKEFWRKNK